MTAALPESENDKTNTKNKSFIRIKFESIIRFIKNLAKNFSLLDKKLHNSDGIYSGTPNFVKYRMLKNKQLNLNEPNKLDDTIEVHDSKLSSILDNRNSLAIDKGFTRKSLNFSINNKINKDSISQSPCLNRKSNLSHLSQIRQSIKKDYSNNRSSSSKSMR